MKDIFTHADRQFLMAIAAYNDLACRMHRDEWLRGRATFSLFSDRIEITTDCRTIANHMNCFRYQEAIDIPIAIYLDGRVFPYPYTLDEIRRSLLGDGEDIL